MSEEMLKILDIEVDKRLFQLSGKELTNLLLQLVKYKTKKDMAKLLSNNTYFSVDDIVKACEKVSRNVLCTLLNEPKEEKALREPLNAWLKSQEFTVHYEVPLPSKGRMRSIDILGFKKGGWWDDDNMIAFELKTSATRGSIDSAFGQAQDYEDCSNRAYVVFSPYVFIKYRDVILEKAEKYKTIGVLVADRTRVTAKLHEGKETDYNEDKWKQVRASIT